VVPLGIGLEPISATDILDTGTRTRGDGAVTIGDADGENKEEIGAVADEEFFFFFYVFGFFKF
jgi:hypothetical protein